MLRSNFIVISGCSGGGKSTLLAELARRNYAVVAEAGRQIVQEQTAINGDALPWTNPEKFRELVLSRCLFQFNSQQKQQLTFFDRSIIDGVTLEGHHAAMNFRYNRLVFLVPPWEKIFIADNERKHSFEWAKQEFDELLIRYKHFGYETMIIPKMTVQERADFVLQKLAAPVTLSGDSGFFITKAKRLLNWNHEKLTSRSHLEVTDIAELFASEFVIIANGRNYRANAQSYLEFLNKFRSDIDSIDYEVQEYLQSGSSVVMPLKATVKRLNGHIDRFVAILLVKYNAAGKIVHWQEVYTRGENA